ncbi:ras GEF [Neocallimastix californiae]|uniref:Ras GEF n=1 Tax=Neocallimastix californiae TaxID=1754190 RepID=A0A1Y2A1K9_9FUNG|nr:ras GEF [Neocallimastix californiae]|eukprot:ORY16197.1 ras GEF [Neocallimastix californiae]
MKMMIVIKKLVRVLFPDQSTTVAQIFENESCWDVLCKVCEKKSLKPEQYSLAILETGKSLHSSLKHRSGLSKQIIDKPNIMDTKKNFYSYNCNSIYLIENGEINNYIHSSRSKLLVRKGSTITSPSSKKTTVRLDSKLFLKNIDATELQDVDNNNSLKRGSKFFGFLLKGHRRDFSDSSSVLCLSPTQSENISLLECVPLNDDLFKQNADNLEKNSKDDIFNNLGSELFNESTDEIGDDSYLIKQEIPSGNLKLEIDSFFDCFKSNSSYSKSASEVTDFQMNKGEPLENDTINLPINSLTGKSRARRRACTVSLGSTDHLITSTLKNHSVLSKRPISGVFEESSNDISDLNKIQIKFTFPDGSTSNKQFNLDSTIDNVCDAICISKQLDPNKHSLILTEKTDYRLEFDRTLGYYKDLNIPIDRFHVIAQSSSKHYSTMIICENDVDVMVFQMSKEGFQIMAGTVPKLIEYLTDNSENNNDFLHTLLLTYRSFITPVDLFNELVARFNCVPPDNPTEDDLIYYEKMKLVVQQRVVKTLRWWVHYHWQDFSYNEQLSSNLDSFLKQLNDYSEENNTDVFKEDTEDITHIMNTDLKAYEEKWNSYKKMRGRVSIILQDSILKNYNEVTIVQHLCLFDFNLFKEIHPIEYLNVIWKTKKNDSEDDNEDNTPNLDKFVSRFNKESYWVATEICNIQDLKKRTNMLKKWIIIANVYIKSNNFYSFFSIISGLSLIPVSRLKKTWDGIGDKHKKIWKSHENLCDPSKNMKNFRDILENSKPPIVPFLLDYEYENINVDSELQNYISHPMVEGDALLMEKSLKLEPRDTKK